MLRRKSTKELGFDPEIVSAIGCATPPCVSKDLAESCSDYVATVVMPVNLPFICYVYYLHAFYQILIYCFLSRMLIFLVSIFSFLEDDIIPRLSVASMERLRNEILQMDW